MYIIDCIPLRKIPRGQPQIFSYFHSNPLPQGSIVGNEIRKKIIPMVVISTAPLKNKKAQIRSQNFQLKPVLEVIFNESIIPSHYLSFLKWVSDYYFSPLSFIFSLALPPTKIILSPTFKSLVIKKPNNREKKIENRKTYHIWGTSNNFFFDEIKGTIKQCKNALIVVPNDNDIEFINDLLLQNSLSTIIYNRRAGVKAWKEIYENILGATDKVIIGGGSSALAPINNLGLVYVLDESNPSYYRSITKPHINITGVGKKLSEITNANFITSSKVPSINKYLEIKNNSCKLKKEGAVERLKFDLIDIRNNPRGKAISLKTIKKMKGVLEQNGKAIIYINRRGHVTTTLCKDCGYINSCDKCSVPYSLHSHIKMELVCHHCDKRTEVPKKCPGCNSHNLDSYGTGTQKIVKELEKKFSIDNILRFDSDTCKTPKDEINMLDKLNGLDKAIFVTTDLFFKHSSAYKFDIGIIANFDQVFFLPDFRIEEKMRRSIFILQSISKELLIQTYNPDREYLNDLKNINASLENDLKSRKALFYPPYSQMIRLVYKNKNMYIAQEKAKLLENRLEKLFMHKKLASLRLHHSPSLPCFITKKQNEYYMEILIRLIKPRSDDDLILRNKLLKFIPSDWEIMVDPLNVV